MANIDEFVQLERKISELRAVLAGLQLTPRFVVADRVMFSLAIDVIEHAIAVQLLQKSEVPRAAYANSRAAFESALDLILLVGRAEDYERNGSLAYVHEIHENTRLQSRFGKADEAGGFSARAVNDYRVLIHAEIAGLQTEWPSSAEALRNALGEFEARKSYEKKHWSGKSRGNIGMAAIEVVGGKAGDGAIADALYGLLSAHSHPRARLTQREWLDSDTDDGLTVSARQDDKTKPQSIAVLACEGALGALRTRRAYGAQIRSHL